jgi:hypothetical protein
MHTPNKTTNNKTTNNKTTNNKTTNNKTTNNTNYNKQYSYNHTKTHRYNPNYNNHKRRLWNNNTKWDYNGWNNNNYKKNYNDTNLNYNGWNNNNYKKNYNNINWNDNNYNKHHKNNKWNYNELINNENDENGWGNTNWQYNGWQNNKINNSNKSNDQSSKKIKKKFKNIELINEIISGNNEEDGNNKKHDNMSCFTKNMANNMMNNIINDVLNDALSSEKNDNLNNKEKVYTCELNIPLNSTLTDFANISSHINKPETSKKILTKKILTKKQNNNTDKNIDNVSELIDTTTCENDKHNNVDNHQNNIFKIDKTRDVDEITAKIGGIPNLIELGKLYEENEFDKKNYSVNIRGLNKISNPLDELNNLIGMQNVKKNIIDQIIYFSQEFHEQKMFDEQEFHEQSKEKEVEKNQIGEKSKNLSNFFENILKVKLPTDIIKNLNSVTDNNTDNNTDNDDDNQDMLHTIIEGPPGVGKTMLGKILAKIYTSLGITKNNKFTIAKRKDFIGEYVGHTAIKTQKLIDSCMGGVLFIDEAYALGNGDSKKDSFSKEAIDTLNQNLSENKGKFVCIIAGYRDELEKDFFSVNQGLKRRFAFKYIIDKYNHEELSKILIYKIDKIGWGLSECALKLLINNNFLEKKMDNFQYFGGDIETWLLKCKIEHAKRVFGKCHTTHKIITSDDLSNGYDKYMENRKKEETHISTMMYT